LLNKSRVSLDQLGRPEEAVAACEQVAADYGADPELRELVAMALLGKGVTLRALDRPAEEELAAYDQVINDYGDDPTHALCEQVAMALYRKGVALATLGRSEEAVAVYSGVVEEYRDNDDPAVREVVERAERERARNRPAPVSGPTSRQPRRSPGQ
jgi:tetratricopeptide (TPR) repeat protein